MRSWNFENFLWLFKQQMKFHKGESFKSYLNYIHKGFKANYRKTINEKELKILRNAWRENGKEKA